MRPAAPGKHVLSQKEMIPEKVVFWQLLNNIYCMPE
jgi:hypothetical protein